MILGMTIATFQAKEGFNVEYAASGLVWLISGPGKGQVDKIDCEAI
jgi:hypothetical protein